MQRVIESENNIDLDYIMHMLNQNVSILKFKFEIPIFYIFVQIILSQSGFGSPGLHRECLISTPFSSTQKQIRSPGSHWSGTKSPWAVHWGTNPPLSEWSCSFWHSEEFLLTAIFKCEKVLPVFEESSVEFSEKGPRVA